MFDVECWMFMLSTRSNWFETFFQGITLDLWRAVGTPELTRTEADFLQTIFSKGARLLDVPCGNGRLTHELARRGFDMVGMDISSENIAEAGKGGFKTAFHVGDMRDLRWTSEFDGAFCWGNSFGYFEYPDTLKFAAGVSRALKPGARFVIQGGMAAEVLIPHFKERETYQIGDITFTIENRYLAEESCLETRGTFVRNGKEEVRMFWHHVYTLAEIRRMLASFGLNIIETFSSLDRAPFALGSEQLILVAQKL
jgi:SAM-dependent methyltransferase